MAAPRIIALSLCASLGLPSVAMAAQPGIGGPGGGMGGGGPMGPAGAPPGGPGGKKQKKEGPAEEAPKDKEALRPITPVPAQPEHRRRVMLFDLHGYFRTRADYFHRLNLGLALQNTDGTPITQNKFFRPPSETTEMRPDGSSPVNDVNCQNRLTERGVSFSRAVRRCGRVDGFSGANVRLRLEPTLHITDTVMVHSQIDLLDNVVLGSTPDTYAYGSPNAPLDLFTRTQEPPQGLTNSTDDSILVKRVWGHIKFGFGLDLQFGRMPNSWGMGLVANSGNGYRKMTKDDIIRQLDRDYGDSVDRIRFAFDFGKDRRRTHTIALTWDWASSGPTTGQLLGPKYESGRLLGQAFSAERFDNVYQWSASIERRDAPDMLQRKLSLGGPVVNYGFITWIRHQVVDDVYSLDPNFKVLGSQVQPDSVQANSPYAERLVFRRALMATPDLWARVMWRTLRLELEAAGNFGTFRLRDINTPVQDPNTYYESLTYADLRRKIIANFGYALEFKYGFFKDRFHIGLDQGYASGDRGANQNSPDVQAPVPVNDDNNIISNFRFNPAYNIDMLLFREQLGTVSNAAYFKPWAAFYFFQNFSGRVDVGYAVANRRQSTLGDKRSYGVELNGALRYHDSREPIFFQLQYGVLFPLGAFNRLISTGGNEDAKAAQTMQAQLGIKF